MTKDVPALVAAASTIMVPFDVAAAAAEIVLPEPDQHDPDLIWLALVTKRADLGLPADPLRPRGWLTFGRPLEDGETVTYGDIVLVDLARGNAAGIVVGTSRGIQFMAGPGEVLRAPKTRVISVRRPIGDPSHG